MLRRIENGETTVHDSKRLKEIILGVLLIGVAIGLGIGALILL